MSDADLQKLTIEILTLSDTLERDRAESVVEIGERFVVARELLGRGEWGRWVADEVPHTKRTALNYIALATWAAEQPGLFGRFKSLGPSKLYALLKLPPKVAGALPDPGSDTEPQLERLAAQQVHALVRELLGEEPVIPPVERLILSGKQRMRGVLEVVDSLADREVEAEAVAGLREMLEDALRRLVG